MTSKAQKRTVDNPQNAAVLRYAAEILRSWVGFRQSRDSKDALREAAATCDDIASQMSEPIHGTPCPGLAKRFKFGGGR